MLDVYRKTYHFTGEPFRLGPDHRFSLHHSSYASAKAYLEYAIFQGEGFVTVTGGPGTGKTTLINEILSLVDKNRIEVSKLTSTQLESRDLLHMVAHSFGIQTDDASKANLLLEIESFLVEKIRRGKRGILIVDEAQGLSEGALEELRLLANLQHQHRLLLQIVLIGQEQLLDLIRQPAMEHLQQRMVAATSLEPLDLDGTIDYIEHRLSRVGWKGDPGIEEGALRLVYGYSGGVPRRINLIMNRLFIYGGMNEKHQYVTGDTQAVIKGLVEEFLLESSPLIDEAIAEKRRTNADAGKRPRYLPREPAGKPTPAKPSDAGADKQKHKRQDADGKSGIRSPRSTDGRKRSSGATSADMDIGSARRNQTQRSGADTKAAESGIRSQRMGSGGRTGAQNDRVIDAAAGHGPKKKRGGKGLFIILLLLAGVGSAYLWREESVSLDQVISLVDEIKGQYQSFVSTFDPKKESEQQALVVNAPIDRGEDFANADNAGKVDHQSAATDSQDDGVETQVEDVRQPVLTESEITDVNSVGVERADTSTTRRIEEAPVVEESSVPAEMPVETGKVATDDIVEAQRAMLRRDAKQRFIKRRNDELARKTALADQVSPPSIIETAPPEKPRITVDQVKQILLQGRWSSAGKPSSLLSSELTSCHDQSAGLVCSSVQQNVKTQYGLARYKVETKLSDFSPEGHFELAYRTLVRPIDADHSNQLASDDAGWQITEYSMSCTLRDNNRVSCLDGKGVTREYHRVLQ